MKTLGRQTLSRNLRSIGLAFCRLSTYRRRPLGRARGVCFLRPIGAVRRLTRTLRPLLPSGVKCSSACGSSHPSCAVTNAMASRPVTLGIDLGTTSVKVALLEAAPGQPSGFAVLASCARAARAETESAAAGSQVRQSPGAAAPERPWGHPGQHLTAKYP